MANAEFFGRIIDKLSHSKAVVRLNLLRILRTVCDVHPDRASLVERFGIYGIVEKLSRQDGAVLVRELAREIMPVLAPVQGLKASATPKTVVAPRRRSRRTSSESGIGEAIPGPLAKTKVRPRQRLNDIPWQASEDFGAQRASRR